MTLIKTPANESAVGEIDEILYSCLPSVIASEVNDLSGRPKQESINSLDRRDPLLRGRCYGDSNRGRDNVSLFF